MRLRTCSATHSWIRAAVHLWGGRITAPACDVAQWPDTSVKVRFGQCEKNIVTTLCENQVPR